MPCEVLFDDAAEVVPHQVLIEDVHKDKGIDISTSRKLTAIILSDALAVELDVLVNLDNVLVKEQRLKSFEHCLLV